MDERERILDHLLVAEAPDPDDAFDGDDETLALDGSRHKACGGTIVTEPVEAHAAPRLRCRDCGERTLL